MNLDGNGITAEIAELSYSIQFKSGVNMYLKEGDLVTFIKNTFPKLKLMIILKPHSRFFNITKILSFCILYAPS
jgi:hypothetical protein